MAASTTGFSLAVDSPVGQTLAPAANRRRRISPEAGRALEMLGHAIEYLADEYAHAGGSMDAGDGEVKAIQLLMALNRQVYFECPVVPSLGERIRAFFHL